MECPTCKTGKFEAGHTTVVLKRNQATIVLKKVPADICDNCGECYLSELVAKKNI